MLKELKSFAVELFIIVIPTTVFIFLEPGFFSGAIIILGIHLFSFVMEQWNKRKNIK